MGEPPVADSGGSRPLPRGYGGRDRLEARLALLLAQGGEKETIGESREGRPIHAYRWGAPDRPGVLVVSLLHPMEWIGLEAHLALVEKIITEKRYGAGSGRQSAVFSIPVANPDGFARVELLLREGRREWMRGNAAHVDLNRNFSVGHRPRPRFLGWWPLYRPGPAALSEPETRAVARWIRGKQVRRSISLHSFGRRIFVPPSRSWRPLSDTPDLLAQARAAAQNGYRAQQLGRWSPFFRARGTELDFLHAETKAPSFLIEISPGGIGAWGPRNLLQPFCLFNPPRPHEEIARVLPVLLCLADPGREES